MKLVRYGAEGREKPGLVDDKGRVRDLSGLVNDIDGAALAPRMLARIARTKPGVAAAGAGQAAPRVVHRPPD